MGIDSSWRSKLVEASRAADEARRTWRVTLESLSTSSHDDASEASSSSSDEEAEAWWAALQGQQKQQQQQEQNPEEESVPETGLYSVLGVPATATQDQIKKAFRRLAKRLHPDRNPNGHDAFLELRHAYTTLACPVQRAAYDRQPPTTPPVVVKVQEALPPRRGVYLRAVLPHHRRS